MVKLNPFSEIKSLQKYLLLEPYRFELLNVESTGPSSSISYPWMSSELSILNKSERKYENKVGLVEGKWKGKSWHSGREMKMKMKLKMKMKIWKSSVEKVSILSSWHKIIWSSYVWVYYILYIVYCILYIVYCIFCIVYFVVYIV